MARKKSWEQISPYPNPEEILLNKAAAAEAAADADHFRAKAEAFKAECQRLRPIEQGQLAAFLMDTDVPQRPWKPMSSAEVAELFGKTPVRMRVYKHLARRAFSCAGGPRTCGGDRAECAHWRGRRLLYRALLKALNHHKAE